MFKGISAIYSLSIMAMMVFMGSKITESYGVVQAKAPSETIIKTVKKTIAKVVMNEEKVQVEENILVEEILDFTPQYNNDYKEEVVFVERKQETIQVTEKEALLHKILVQR